MTPNMMRALSICAHTNTPTMISGDPGEGKTNFMRALMEALGFTEKTLPHPYLMPNPASGDPADWSGCQAVTMDEGEKVSDFTIPGGVRRLQKSKPGALNPYGEALGLTVYHPGGGIFISELTTLHPRLQAPFLALFDDRKQIGTHSVPLWVWPCADANPPDIAANGQELAIPLISRLTILGWEFDHRAWTRGLTMGFPTPKIPLVPDEWVAALPTSRAKIAAFGNAAPEFLRAGQHLRNLKDHQRGQPYPTPRGWTAVSKLDAACDAMGDTDDEVRTMLFNGTVGTAAATAYFEYLDKVELQDPKEFLDDPTKFVTPKRGDMLTVVLTAMVSTTVLAKDPKWWKSCWTILTKLASDGKLAETIMAAPPLMPLYLGDREKFPLSKKDLEQFIPLMKRSGMM